jgi:hypothetical protein
MKDINIPFEISTNPNQPVLLLEDIFLVKAENWQSEANGKIWFSWLPFAQYSFELTGLKLTLDDDTLNSQGKTIQIQSQDLQLKGVISNISFSDKVKISGHIIQSTKKNVPEFSEIYFLIPNFSDYISIPKNKIGLTTKEIHLSADNWELHIYPISNNHEIIKNLKASNGYNFTHVSTLVKKDRQKFSISDLIEFFDYLTSFFSFVRGFWVSPVIPFDKKGKILFDAITKPRISHWENWFSWSDRQYAEGVSILFPKLFKKWCDPFWKKHLNSLIYWYVMSNMQQGGLDGAIVMSQIGLELMSWTLLVQDKKIIKIISSKKYKKYASEKFRKLFSCIGLPLDIPDELNKLKTFARQNNIKDAPHAITEIRNEFVHPKKKYSNVIDTNIKIETWKLTLWYLELTILKILDYNGQYFNRLKKGQWQGQVEPLPWNPFREQEL